MFTGTIPDYSTEVKGLLLSGVVGGGPAEEAGLQKGDVIVEIAGQTIANIYDYTYALDVLKIGQPAKVVYMRDGKKAETTLTPARESSRGASSATGLAHDLFRRLVVTQRHERRVTQAAVARPFRERHLGHLPRLHPAQRVHLFCRHAFAPSPAPVDGRFANGQRDSSRPRIRSNTWPAGAA